MSEKLSKSTIDYIMAMQKEEDNNSQPITPNSNVESALEEELRIIYNYALAQANGNTLITTKLDKSHKSIQAELSKIPALEKVVKELTNEIFDITMLENVQDYTKVERIRKIILNRRDSK